MPISTLRLLGEFTLELEGSRQPLRLGRKGRALLACAAMRSSAGASRGRLIALLWADQGDEEARNALRQCLHLVRRGLGANAQALDSDGEHIVLRPGCFDVDVHRFEALAASSEVASMLAAADLYRGEFLEGMDAGLEFSRWAANERERLRDTAHALLTRLSEGVEEADEIEATVRLAHRLLAADPVHEGCYRALMRLHARAGLRAKALQAWNECRRVLHRELNVEPSAETMHVVEQVRHGATQGATGHPRASVTMMAAATVPAAQCGTEDPMVLDLMLRGWQFFSLHTAESNAQARAAFEVAAAHARDRAQALALLGWTHWFDSISGWSEDAALSYRLAEDCAARALACSQGHSSCHSLQGKVLLWRMQHDSALEQMRREVALAPASGYSHFNLGDATMWSGHSEEALSHLEHALELVPNDHGVFLTIRGKALWMAGRLREALASLESAVTRNPTYSWAHAALIAVHYERGDLEAARDAAATARRLNRRLSISFAEQVLPYRVAEHRRRAAQAWRAAGMPRHEKCLNPTDAVTGHALRTKPVVES
jgi:DNA-binding SARP family transcriptional activator/Tfp pilus assembly protein PilF